MSAPRLIIVAEERGPKSHAVLGESLELLRAHYDVTVTSPGDAGSADGVRLYLLEDSGTNVAVRQAAISNPGIVWLHDLYEREPCSPTLLEAAASATCALFSSLRNLAEYRKLAEGFGRESWYLPYPIRARERGGARRGYVATCATPLVEDQMHLVLRALARSADAIRLGWLVSESEEPSARRLIAQAGVEGRVELMLGRGLERWSALVREASLALHFHVSAFGDCGPELGLSMLSGVPVGVSDFSESGLLPEGVALRLEPGECAGEMLESWLLKLAAGEAFAETSALGKAYAEEFFDARCVISELRSVIEAVRNSSYRPEGELKQQGIFS